MIWRRTPSAFSMVAVPTPFFSRPDTHARTSDGLISPAALCAQCAATWALYADSVLTTVEGVRPLRLPSHRSASAPMVMRPVRGSM